MLYKAVFRLHVFRPTAIGCNQFHLFTLVLEFKSKRFHSDHLRRWFQTGFTRNQWGSQSASDPRAKNTGQRATKGTVLTSQNLSPWCDCRRLGSALASWRWQDINVGNPLWRQALLETVSSLPSVNTPDVGLKQIPCSMLVTMATDIWPRMLKFEVVKPVSELSSLNRQIQFEPFATGFTFWGVNKSGLGTGFFNPVATELTRNRFQSGLSVNMAQVIPPRPIQYSTSMKWNVPNILLCQSEQAVAGVLGLHVWAWHEVGTAVTWNFTTLLVTMPSTTGLL